MYVMQGTNSLVRMVDITQMSLAFGSEVCLMLLGLHSLTGCGSASALGNHGKVKALRILQQHQPYRQAFISLGESWDLPPEIFKQIQTFTCHSLHRLGLAFYITMHLEKICKDIALNKLKLL